MVKVQLGSFRANSLEARRTWPLLLAGLLAFGVGATGHHLRPDLTFPRASAPVTLANNTVMQEIADSAPAQMAAEAAEEVQQMAAAMVTAKPEAVSREVELNSGRNFAALLTDADVAPDVAQTVAAALKSVYDPKKLKAGQEVTLAFTRLGTEETLTGVTLQPEPTKEVTITRGADGQFTASVNTTPIERKRMAARSVIRTSLYEAGEREGVPRAVMAALIRAYSHEVDFQRDLHAGDKVEVLYDQPTAKDGSPAGQAVIIYAALEIAGKVKPLYRVTFNDGTVDYMDERGQSVKRSLLRTPVEGVRVTSGFGMRMHPLLGFTKMHKGTDFGAAPGTPIFAAGPGVVEEVTFNGGYGRYIRLRHNGRIQTAYAHMSRFARGMYPGARVNQGDVIGFVGSSGRSTGPHLHYEVMVDRQQVNPLSVSLPTGRSLQGSLLTQFRQGQAQIRQEFSSLLEKDFAPTMKKAETEPAKMAMNNATKK